MFLERIDQISLGRLNSFCFPGKTKEAKRTIGRRDSKDLLG